MPLAVPFCTLLSKRKIQFAAIGFTAMTVSYGCLFLLVDIWHVNALVAYVVQSVVAIEVNFFLNRRLTWADRPVGYWRTWRRFHVTRVVIVPLNQLLFTSLIWTGMHYLVAHTICIVVATVINYMLGDRFIFVCRESSRPRRHVAPHQASLAVESAHSLASFLPHVSVVVPVKNSQGTIRPLVKSLLVQDYAGQIEIILVGDEGDMTWSVLGAELASGAVVAYEVDVRAPQRDANAKRDVGLRRATGDVLALTDSDMQLPSTWVRTAVEMLAEGDEAVAGPMISITPGFWGRYIDENAWGSKTPRMANGYLLTTGNFGRGRHKPPVTANFVCTRAVYERVGGPPVDFSYSYEDYPWFRMIVDAGYSIRCDQQLAAHHSHRSGFKSLVGEYWRSGWGCADYLALYPNCPLVRKRVVQLGCLFLAGAAGLATIMWVPLAVLGVVAFLATLVSVNSVVRSRRVSALAFPMCTAVLGTCFAAGMVERLARQRRRAPKPVIVKAIRKVPAAIGDRGAW